MGLLGGVFVLTLLAAGLGVRNHHTGYVDLYPVKLAAHELPDISRALLAAGIEHEVTPNSDGVLLSRQDRTQARSLLASLQLPRHRVLTPEEAKNDLVRGAAEKRLQAQQILEGELTMALREIDGIRDARVKIAVPERNYFNNEQATTASVALTVEPGAQFNAAAIQGISSMIAFSVPGLTADKVVLVDNTGRDLMAAMRGPDGLALGAHFEVLAKEEARRQLAVQDAMDAAFPGRTKVVVALEMDFSEAERRIYTPGDAEDRGLVKAEVQLASEVLAGTGGSKGDKNYDNHKEAVRYKYTENYYANLIKHARVVRTTAGVMADGFSPDEAEKLKETVIGILGMRSEQGDFVYVNTSPWDRDINPEPAALPAPVVDSPSNFSSLGLIGLLLGQGVLLFGLAGVVLFATRRHSKAGVLGGTPASAAVTGIVDHRQTKIGETILESPLTSVQRSQMLEGIVKDRPAQVADLLRSTWLS